MWLISFIVFILRKSITVYICCFVCHDESETFAATNTKTIQHFLSPWFVLLKRTSYRDKIPLKELQGGANLSGVINIHDVVHHEHGGHRIRERGDSFHHDHLIHRHHELSCRQRDVSCGNIRHKVQLDRVTSHFKDNVIWEKSVWIKT